ncbi:MAG: protein phosphatase 2C domain-containing protein [Planctomycetes bacterium]|nr:protein phosphatase 2C domain-containing protein [Planctomycetota bacterium]
MELRVIQHIGKRDTQQDSRHAGKFDSESGEFIVSIVADGVGSTPGGSWASFTTTKAYARQLHAFATGERHTLATFRAHCERARHAATKQLARDTKTDPELGDAATTLSACVIINGHAFFTNIGDSPILIGNKNGVRIVSEEHSRAARLVAAGALTRDEYENSPFRGVLASYISLRQETSSDAHYAHEELQEFDRLIVCSDGAFEAAGEVLTAVACCQPWIDTARHQLERAIHAFATDNATLIIAGNDDTRALDELTFEEE